jgi:LysR family transcriptional regulator, glycine cleavage system transcriptional activator
MKDIHRSRRVSRARLIAPSAALMAFERAATHLNFRRAAQDLALTPSAISHQVRSLEEQFGVRLFARAGRSVRLTPAGETYFRSVSQALGILEESGRALLERLGQSKSELRVSSLPFFTHTVLIPALADFHRKYPGIALHIDATHRYADFDATDVDVAIRFGRENASGLRLEPLTEVRGLPVCAPHVAKRLRTLDDIAQQTLIHVTAQPSAWRAWLNAAGRRELEGGNDLRFDNTLSALEAAEHGLGLALAMHPLILGRRGFGRLLVAPFENPVQSSQSFYFVCRPEQARDRRVTAFRGWLLQAVKRACR